MAKNKEFLANTTAVITQLSNELHRNGCLDSGSKIKLDALMGVVRLSPTLNTDLEVMHALANLQTLLEK